MAEAVHSGYAAFLIGRGSEKIVVVCRSEDVV